MIKTYFSLTKPKMIRGNLVLTAAGFLLASKGVVDLKLFIATLIGISFVIACGCVVNNYIDRDIDKKMARTQERAFAKGEVKSTHALIFASILGLVGFAILFFFTSFAAFATAFVGAVFYIALYSPLKHRTAHAALVGSIAGAVPIVVGYTAVMHQLDALCILLFVMLVLWQMPHFFAISLYRMEEYKAAGVPVYSLQKGIFTTKLHLIIYVNAFITTTLLLTLFGYAGYVFAGLSIVLGIIWLWFAAQGFNTKTDTPRWARKMFRYSLLVLMVLAVTLSLNSFLI